MTYMCLSACFILEMSFCSLQSNSNSVFTQVSLAFDVPLVLMFSMCVIVCLK